MSLGIDISGVDDIDPTLNFTDSHTAVAQSVMTTLLHGPGTLWWAPTIGDDIRRFLHDVFDKEATQRAVVKQAELDERVDSASADAELLSDGSMIIRGNIVSSDGTDTQFTLSISQAGQVINAA